MRRMYSEKELQKISKQSVESALSGEIQDAIGLNSSGELVKGAISGGTQLYIHSITLSDYPSYSGYKISSLQIESDSKTFSYGSNQIVVINTRADAYTELSALHYTDILNGRFNLGTGYIYKIIGGQYPSFKVIPIKDGSDTGIIGTISVSSLSITDDTVTEL